MAERPSLPESAGGDTLLSPRPVLLLATRSAGKLRELMSLLGAASFGAETLDDAGLIEEPAEDGLEVFETFEENALAKARWFARRAPGRIVLADDSGLAVAALAGAPGVRSKRWSGAGTDAGNNTHLLRELERAGALDGSGRRAAYVCVAAAVWPGGELIARGETTGTILSQARGGGGFGYDPYFSSFDLGGRTFAEATREEKATVSHRGRAFRALLAQLETALAARPV